MKTPAASLVLVTVKFVAVSRRVSFAFGIAAPEESVTVPCTEVRNCASADEEISVRNANKTTPTTLPIADRSYAAQGGRSGMTVIRFPLPLHVVLNNENAAIQLFERTSNASHRAVAALFTDLEFAQDFIARGKLDQQVMLRKFSDYDYLRRFVKSHRRNDEPLRNVDFFFDPPSLDVQDIADMRPISIEELLF